MWWLQANEIIAKYQLNLEFLLDGSATPNEQRQCLAQKWYGLGFDQDDMVSHCCLFPRRPWVSTFIVTRDPWNAAVSDDSTKGYDRSAQCSRLARHIRTYLHSFEINNMPEFFGAAALEAMRKEHYGFVHGDSLCRSPSPSGFSVSAGSSMHLRIRFCSGNHRTRPQSLALYKPIIAVHFPSPLLRADASQSNRAI